MIFTTINESNEIIFNEGFKFKTKEEAERALKKVENNENETWEYISYCFKMTITIFSFGILGMLLIQALTKWLAFPGTTNDKIKKCNKFIKKCDEEISKYNRRDDKESKKIADELEKVREKAVKARTNYERDSVSNGRIGSNWKESAIFDDIDFI